MDANDMPPMRRASASQWDVFPPASADADALDFLAGDTPVLQTAFLLR